MFVLKKNFEIKRNVSSIFFFESWNNCGSILIVEKNSEV